jgi:outer membrane immunogenic protein
MLVGAALAALAGSPALAQSFEGPYVGVQAGWNHDTAIQSDKDAVVGGAFAGYDHEVAPNIVIGAEGGFQLAASDKIGPAGTDQAVIDPHYSFDLSARAGYVVGGNNLLYARGGYANTRARFTNTVAGTTVSDARNLDGWFVGGGVERKLTDTISTRLEYRFNDFDQDGAKYQRHQVLAGVAYRF